MKSYLKVAIVLAGICAVAAILLATVNQITEPVIKEYEEKVVFDALKDVSCSMDIGEEVSVQDNTYISSYYPLTKDNKKTGYILNLKSNGYGGEINIAASFDTQGKILAVKMISNSETPGVGKKSENEGYMDKFIGTGTDRDIPTKKTMLSDSDLATVSGATITFTGISKSLESGSNFVKEMGGLK